MANVFKSLALQIQLMMNQFAEIYEQASQQHYGQQMRSIQGELKLYNNGYELQSQVSVKNDKVTHVEQYHQPKKQQIPQISTKFKLVLPAINKQEENVQRNSLPKGKKINIKGVKDQVRQSKIPHQIQIINLQDDIVEEIIINNKPDELTIKGSEYIGDAKNDEDYNNSFLDIAEKIIKPIQIKQQDNVEEKKHIQIANQSTRQMKQSQLFVRSKILVKEAQIGKNIFYNSSKQNDDLKYILPQSSSKNSLDTNLYVSSVVSSRDELSTRNILNYQKPRRNKLPALKPYSQIMKNEKIIVSAPSQNILNQDNEKQAKIVQKGKISINSYEIGNVSQFIKNKIPQNKKLQCKLRRNKTCAKKFFLDYDLQTNDGKFLLSIKKMPFCIYSTYHISLMNGQYNQKNDFFLAKVEGNFIGSVFNLFVYDNNSFQQKQMVATIYYNSDYSICSEKYREMQIYIKSDSYRFFQLEGTELEKGKNLKDLYQVESNRVQKKIEKFINKKPKWNPQYQVYTMNFHGKSRMGSVKNTIIVKQDDQKDQAMLFAKQSTDQFAFDICYPFSPLAALGLMITGFDFKLASQ